MKWGYRAALAVGSCFTSAAAAAPCAAPGEPVQWIADYCMLKIETDDEIAASGCIEGEMKRSFPSACASNVHFKRTMCELMVRAGTRSGTVEQCVRDPSFKGRTIENNGVGP
jgi:hypothetical protein